MDGESRRAHQRFKDDQRVCRAQLEDQCGKSVKLSVIDLGAGGAALTGARKTSRTPRAGRRSMTAGRVRMQVPSLSKGKGTKSVDIGPYEVVREWPCGLGNDAGVAVRFTKPRKGWLKHVNDERFPGSLDKTDT